MSTTEQKVFDLAHTQGLTNARLDFLNEWLPQVAKAHELRTALDVGCGVGHFSAYLSDMGFQVTAIDGRAENVEEARNRYSSIPFYTMDVEDSIIKQLGVFDLVLCFGLLYHLENPFSAVRNLFAMTGKILLIESACAPSRLPVAVLLSEGSDEDQSLHRVAFYPSESCLAKLLYRAGFPFVYRFGRLPSHRDFRTTFLQKQVRTMLIASKTRLSFPIFHSTHEPREIHNLWVTPWGWIVQLPIRVWRFMCRPWEEKVEAVRRYLR